MVLREILFSTLSPYADILYPLIYLAFFSISLTALYSDRWRKLFLIILFTGIFTSGILQIQISPFINLNKYTLPAADSLTHFEMKAVDESGREIRVDDRALGYSFNLATAHSLNSSNNRQEKRRKISRLTLESIGELRKRVVREKQIGGLRFPPPARPYRWNSSFIRDYSEFDTVRIDRLTIVFKENSAKIKKIREKTVYEFEVAESRTK